MAAGAQTNGDIIVLDNGSYPAVDFRKFLANQQIGPGAVDYSSFRISLSAGATLNIGAGSAFVRQPGDMTLYRVSQDGVALQVTLDANTSSNPRVDQIILHMYDGSAAGDTSNQFYAAVEVLNGTATSGATLDNRSGAADPQAVLTTGKAYIALADVLMPAGATTVSAGNIRNRRPMAIPGVVPPLNANNAVQGDTYQVTPEPWAGLGTNRMRCDGVDIASFSSAALFWNPAPIAATKLRWRYIQGGVSGDGQAAVSSGFNWHFVICDASGRLIADTGNVAFAGSAGSFQQVNATLSVPYTGYVIDAGPIYAWFGVGGITTGQSFYTTGVMSGGVNGGNASTGWAPPAANLLLYLNSGGVTFDTSNTILNMHDMNGSTGATTMHIPVPNFALCA